jgi:PQQ-like domain
MMMMMQAGERRERRTAVLVAALAVVLIIVVASIYVTMPQLFRGSQTTGEASTGSSGLTSTSTAQELTSSTNLDAEDWTTYHADNARTGYMATPNFTSVTASWVSPSLDGSIYAEPLVFRGDVYVATENNSIYALGGQNGSILWRRNLGAPVAGDQLQCGDINPSGITGTPVIDPSTGTLFVVSFNEETITHTLSAINTTTGAIIFQRPADPPGFVDTAQQERSALSLANGMVYIPYGGIAGDCGQYHGWVVGIPENGTGNTEVYQVPTSREGGIWAPSGAAIDQSGNVYVTTGNGASITTYDHGDSVIKLSSSLSEEGYFAPTNWSVLNQNDADLGSLGPAIIGSDTLFQIGKEGVGYILNASQLGGIGGQTFSASVCLESFGGTAFSSPYVFVPCTTGLVELELTNGGFTTVWQGSGYNAGAPAVTGGVVWTVNNSSPTLLGYSIASGHQLYSFPLSGAMTFTGPVAGDGHVIVATGDTVTTFMLG